MSDDWGFADVYAMDDEPVEKTGQLTDVVGEDWRNILVLGRATADGVYPETLSLVGRARHMADELGCRVEVLLIGENLDAATEALKRYPIDTVYRVSAPDYAPIDHTARIIQQVVRKRRPELVMVFQSRTGDALTAYAASRSGAGFVVGAIDVQMDTMERKAIVRHQAVNAGFIINTHFTSQPQFVSVQRGLFRSPMEDPYANVTVHDLDIDAGQLADIRVTERREPKAPDLATAETVVIAGSRVATSEALAAAEALAKRLGAAFGVTRAVVERGLADETAYSVVGWWDVHVAPRLLVTVGCRGALDFQNGIEGTPVIAALGNDAGDAIAGLAAYLVPGDPAEAMAAFEAGL